MVKFAEPQLDLVFAALSDSTRRSVLSQLAKPEGNGLTVTELAQPHGLSLPGFMKHLAVLEAAGLIARSKEGRVVRCEFDGAALQGAATWITRYERFWAGQLDALGRYLYQQEELTPWKKPSSPPRSASTASTASRPKRSGARGPSRKR